MAVVLYCGFKTIDAIDAYFRRPELAKGRLLYESNHVHSVKETDGTVSAKCVSQQGKHVYDVELELSAAERRILKGKCSCRYGILGDCKHCAAVALYVNLHEDASCTSGPQAWGKPSSRPGINDKVSIEELFGDSTSPFVGNKQPAEYPPFYVLEHFSGIDSPFTEMLQHMQKSEAEIICSDIVDHALQAAVTISQRQKIDALIPSPCRPLHTLEVSGSFPTLSIAPKNHLQQLTAEERTFYSTCIVCQSVHELCVQTIGQSSCPRWHKERKLRISSTTAHAILRTRRGPEQILASLLKDRHFYSEATSYGMRMEPEARRDFEQQLNIQVIEVGLLLHPEQPCLCGSPDGIFLMSNELYLLEIKCPHKCRDKEILDACGKSVVEYLQYTGGKLMLKKTHKYYTQVQILLYLLNAKQCFFFVYSKKQSVTVSVSRDDSFLQQAIPTLEEYYFKWLLPALVKQQDT